MIETLYRRDAIAVLALHEIVENESHCHKLIIKIVHLMSCSTRSLTNSIEE